MLLLILLRHRCMFVICKYRNEYYLVYMQYITELSRQVEPCRLKLTRTAPQTQICVNSQVPCALTRKNSHQVPDPGALRCFATQLAARVGVGVPHALALGCRTRQHWHSTQCHIKLMCALKLGCRTRQHWHSTQAPH